MSSKSSKSGGKLDKEALAIYGSEELQNLFLKVRNKCLAGLWDQYPTQVNKLQGGDPANMRVW